MLVLLTHGLISEHYSVMLDLTYDTGAVKIKEKFCNKWMEPL